MAERLSDRSLKWLPSTVMKPAYDRSKVTPGIVHLGVGAFHRAHQAVLVDDCLAAGQTDWGIVGVSLRSPDTRDALAPQDGLYTLAVRGSGTEALRIVGSIQWLLVAPENPPAVLDALTDPQIRIVTLTITEKAYLRDAAGNLDASHADIVADLANPARPKTAPGFLVEALARRRAAGIAPFTVLSCDNLPANGATLRRLLIQFAKLRDPELACFVEDQVACPSSMIDRIVPATTDADRARISANLGIEDAWPVMTEPFRQWVIEDNFTAGRPDWEKAGATMVRDVTPFEEMKLRLLNGAHSAIAYLGLLSGHETVALAFADPAIRAFVGGLWAEAIPTLPTDAGLDPKNYVVQLADRFANTALAHRTAQIATDGRQKLPQRIVATALERLERNQTADHLALAVAGWIKALSERGRTFPENHFTDPLDNRIGNALGQRSEAGIVNAVFNLTGFAKGSAHRDALMDLVAGHLKALRTGKPAAILAALAKTEKKS
jgi:fructuronate reductase